MLNRNPCQQKNFQFLKKLFDKKITAESIDRFSGFSLVTSCLISENLLAGGCGCMIFSAYIIEGVCKNFGQEFYGECQQKQPRAAERKLLIRAKGESAILHKRITAHRFADTLPASKYFVTTNRRFGQKYTAC